MKVFKNGKLVYVIINGIKYIISNSKPVAPPDDIPVTSTSIANKIATLTQDTTHQLNVNVLPNNATDKLLTYTSSDTSIATVSNAGLITAKSVGSCAITVKSNNNISDTMSLSVIEEIIDEDISKYIYPNDLNLYATCDGYLVSEHSLFDEGSKFYSTSTKDTVTFNEQEQRYYLNKKVHAGIIRNFDAGLRKPIYIEGNDYAISNTNIGDLLCKGSTSNVSNPTSLVMNIDKTVPVSYLTPNDTTNTSPDNPLGIATYGSFPGLIGALGNPYSMTNEEIVNFMNGKTIRYMLSKEISIPLLKQGESIGVTGIKLNKTIIGLELQSSKQLVAEVNPPLASNKNIVWTSSDENVATVTDGFVISKNPGRTIITATTQEGNYSKSTNIIVSEPYTEEQLFKGAYVQVYYYEPKINLGTDLNVEFYISDEEQSELYHDDYNKKFTLIVTIDDKEFRYTGLSSGDQFINLGKLTEGEHSIVFQGIDESTGARGMAIYKEVWVVNPLTYPITEAQTYCMTEGDLVDFGINNKDSAIEEDMWNTIYGINNMFKFYKDKGYRKFVMLPGTYRVKNTKNRTDVIKFLSNMDYDLNGAIFKYNPALDITSVSGDETIDYPATIIRWDNVIDTHIYNGVLEGDRAERNEAGLEGGSKGGERLSAIHTIGGRYSSITNMTIRQISGHAVVTNPGSACGFMLNKYTFDEFKPSIINSTNNFNGKFFILNGEIVNGDYYYTSGMQDLKTWKSSYVIFGNNSGYSWFRGLSNYVYFHFYDEDGDFVTTVASMQYRPVMIPIGCRFVRYSIKSFVPDFEGGVLFYSEQGTHISLSENYFEECRTCAYAPKTSRSLLMEKNNYVNCGNRITASSLDFEDGWQQSMDVFYRDNDCTDSPLSSASLITVAGVNHVYENNRNHGIYGKHYMAGCVYRNCNNGKWIKMGMSWDHESRYNRIYNNNDINLNISQWVGEFGVELDRKEKHAKLSVNGGSYIGSFPGGYNRYATELDYDYSKIKNVTMRGNGSNTHFIKSDIHPESYQGGNLFFDDCSFYNFDDVNSNVKFSFNALDAVREFRNCAFKSPTQLWNHGNFNSGLFDNCTFEKTTSIYHLATNNIGDIQFDNCKFKDAVTIQPGANSYIQFNNCVFENGYTLSGSYGSNVQFNATMPSKSVSAFRITTTSYNITLTANAKTKDQRLNYWITPANANNKNIIWNSSDKSVATVNSIGLVTCISGGTAIITGRTEDGNYTAIATFNVTKNF